MGRLNCYTQRYVQAFGIHRVVLSSAGTLLNSKFCGTVSRIVVPFSTGSSVASPLEHRRARAHTHSISMWLNVLTDREILLAEKIGKNVFQQNFEKKQNSGMGKLKGQSPIYIQFFSWRGSVPVLFTVKMHDLFVFFPWSGCPDHGRKMTVHSGAKSNKVVGSIPRSLLSA